MSTQDQATRPPITAKEGEVIDRLARGESVPGAPGACARPGCGHGYPWHTPKTRDHPCERCGCRGLVRQPSAVAWTRVEDDHPRWEIKNPGGDGRNYLLTDEAIRTFGRDHLQKLMAGLPPLPEEAWTPPARRDVTIMTNHEIEPGICGHPGSNGGVCGLAHGHDEPHRPVHARRDPEPVRTPQEMILRYLGMLLAQAMTLLSEADQAHAGDQAETLGVFIREERDPLTRALISAQRCKVTRQDDGSYLVTVTDEVGEERR